MLLTFKHNEPVVSHINRMYGAVFANEFKTSFTEFGSTINFSATQ